ncbi:MAG: LacI family DNA-binding transcriptional regulator [Flavobacteriaceae bacterium]|nr:LacI family DNA-binding transcriptional regulator [Flavobacteriaceae bacterium]
MKTIKDLATILGVSISTVSKALNDSKEISDSTKYRVQKLAKSLNYKPNKQALRLKKSKTNTIGVIIPDTINAFFAEALQGIEQYATANNYELLISLSNESLEKEINAIKNLSQGSVDGFIIAMSREAQLKNYTQHFKEILDRSLGLVLFDRVHDAVACDKIIVNDYHSVYEATEFLILQQHKKNILLVSNIADLSVEKLRTKGYTDAIKAHKLKKHILNLNQEKELGQKIKKHLSGKVNIDAILSIDYISGLIALNTVLSMGFKVPQEFTIISFGFSETLQISNNHLMLILQNGKLIGAKSAELLIHQVEKSKPYRQTLTIPNELIIHQTYTQE